MWVERFYDVAKLVSTWSKDPDCQVGAVVVTPDRRVVSTGYNGLPACIADDPAKLRDKAWKLQHVVHAEVNALARVSEKNCVLYVTKPPCLDCAQAMINAKITTVYCPEPSVLSSWYQVNLAAIKMLKRSNISVLFVP